jgi:predicted permease
MIQDLRFAIRSLARARGFFVAAVLTLALGVGANTIVYAIVNGSIIRPLPFGERSARLITVHSTHPTQAQDWDDSDVSYPDLIDLRERVRMLEGLEGVLNRNLSLTATETTERVSGASVTPGLFALLGVRPMLGRDFSDQDAAEPGFEPVAIISHRLWQRLYGGDGTIVGRAIPVNGRVLTVIGVMPDKFAFPVNQDVWLPYRASRQEFRGRRNLLAVGLLRPGIELGQARADLAAVAASLEAAYPETNREWGLHALALRDLFVREGTRRALTAMLLAVGLVLLVVCANVASLLVARGVGRERELTVRVALGASRARIIRLLLAESVLLSLAGAVLALMLASWGLDALVASVPEQPVYWAEMTIDGGVLAFTAAVTMLSAIASGLLPALRLGKAGGSSSTLQTGRGSGMNREQRRVQGFLVTGQVALSFVLLVAATLSARSAMMLRSADTGFDPSPLLSFRVYLAGDAYNDPGERARAVDRLVNRLHELPGVRAAAATGAIPSDDGGEGVMLIPVRPAGVDQRVGAQLVPITAAFFDSVGLRLIEGRTFSATEMARADETAVIVNKRLANLFWPQESAVGRDLRIAVGRNIDAMRVVGVAPDLVYEELGEETPQSQLTIYAPYIRSGWRTMAVLVRAETKPEALASAARDAVRSTDTAFATFDLMTMEERRRMTSWGEQFLGRTFSAFALAAVFLACVGAYGLTAHAAAQRTREIGIRIAIGATRPDILRLLLGGGTRLAAIGALVGLPLAVAAARFLEGELFRVSPWTAGMWLVLPLVLVGAVLAASFLPAHRASLTDPAIALRHD